MSLDIDAADRFTQGALDERDRALPAGPHLRGAGQRPAIEVEIGGDEIIGEVRGIRADDLPRQPVAPLVEVGGDERRRQALQEARLANDDLIEGTLRHAHGIEPQVQVDRAEQPAGALPRHEVVRLLAVAGGDVVPVVGGELGFELEDARSPGRGIVEAGERDHVLEIFDVLGANRRRLLFAVVRLVGKAQPTLLDEDEIALRLPGVVVDEDLRES